MKRLLVTLALLISLVGTVMGSGMSDMLEKRPFEATAEKLFEKGIGKPWVGGNPPWYKEQIAPIQALPYKPVVGAGSRFHYYPLGSVLVNNYLTIGEGTYAMRIPYNQGQYLVLGCYDEYENLAGIYIDLGSYTAVR
jgi:hypothetical protein